MSLIVFSHANSFPAGTYGVLFKQLRARGFTVKAPDKFGHEPQYAASNNWPQLVQQLHDFAEREVQKFGEPAFLVGHSLGGFLSVMCAARHPQLARGVLLLDSPLLGGWKSHALRAAKRTPLVGAISPGAVSRKRKYRWPSREAALDHFQPQEGLPALGTRRCWPTTSPTARTTRTASASSASTATSRPRSTTRCRTTCSGCCSGIPCAAPRPSSAAWTRRRSGKWAWP